jgi:CheY-like chemotaxis protein
MASAMTESPPSPSHRKLMAPPAPTLQGGDAMTDSPRADRPAALVAPSSAAQTPAPATRDMPSVSMESPDAATRDMSDAGATFSKIAGLCSSRHAHTSDCTPPLFGRPGGLPPPPREPAPTSGTFAFLSPEPDAPRPGTRPRASSEGSAPPSPQFGQMRIGESRAWASVTSLRRSDGRLSGGVVGVAVLDSNPERRKKCVEVLRDAARSIGANIARALAVEGFSNASSCRRRMDERSGPRFRLVLCDGGDVGAAITAAAGLQGVSVVAVQAPSEDEAPRPRTSMRTIGGPVTSSLAHELLWAHALPHGPCAVSGTKPVTSALKLAEGVGASLRAGGLRGLLMLLHAERRERAKALDQLLDRQTSETPRTPCVLVVDDSAVARKLHVRALERALTSLGCAGDVLVEEACDGQEACAAVHDDAKNRKRCVVLCLLDLAMPIMGGCAAARRLRAAGATAPVVAVTAAALPREEFEDDTERASLQDLDDDDDAIALAFDDVISKPFGFGDALSAVERWVLPRLHRKRRGDSPGRLPRVEVEGGPARAPAPAKRRR